MALEGLEALPRGPLAAAMSFQNFRAEQALELVMACVVPTAVFAVGVASYDLLHIFLLFGLVIALLGTTLKLKPTLCGRGGGPSSVRIGVQLLRLYSAVVLLAMSIVYFARVVGFASVLKPYQGVLQILGLWHPSVVDMMSFAALLAVSAAQTAVAEAAAKPPGSLEGDIAGGEQVPKINGVPTWLPRWQLLLGRKTSTYGAMIVTVVLYCLVLFNCDVAFIGLGYMAVATWCLAVQPQKGQWRALENREGLDGDDSVLNTIILGVGSLSPPRRNQQIRLPYSSSSSSVWLVGSSTISWVPLLSTTILATLDFLLQISLPALAANFYISDEVLKFIKTAVGVDVAPTNQELALLLLRPVLILACVYTFRRLYSLGILHRQLAHAALNEDAYQQHRLAKQWCVGAFVKRFLILHASKLVVLVAFAAAMQDTSAIGWALVVGVVLIPPLLSPNGSSNTNSNVALHAALIATYSVASLWLLAQYTIQISWIKSLLMSSTITPNMLTWLGIDWCTAGTDSPPPSILESLLRWKALLLVAVALNQKVLIWWIKLPDVVQNEAKCGAKCPLFWPPAPTFPFPVDSHTRSAAASLSEETELSLSALPSRQTTDEEEHPEQAMETESGLQTLNTARVALHNVAQKARTLAQQALTAVDWPASPRPSTAGTAPEGYREENHDSPSLEEHPSSRSTSSQLMAFRFALQDWVERCYDDWGLEIALFTLLVAAFVASNALSLIYLAAVAIGMVVPSRARRTLWMWVVLPVLGVILVWQYSELVGLPPTTTLEKKNSDLGFFSIGFLSLLKWNPTSPLAEDVKSWLGLTDVDPHAVWALFIAYGATVLQFSCDRGRTRCPSSSLTCGRGSSHSHTIGMSEDSTLVLPLLNNDARISTSSPLPENESPFFISPYESHLWAPLKYSAQHHWKWHDWARYTVYRRSLDILLVAVVALCTLDNDIIHAGYLALALFFFRSRVNLRARRNSLFAWLPLYNFAVMAIVLAYQAPFEDVWDWPLDDGTSCTLAHLLGLYKLRRSSSAPLSTSPSFGGGSGALASLSRFSSLSSRASLLSWGYEGSIADLILWVFIRLQSHLFASPTYRQVVSVAEAEESQERAARKAEVAEWKQSQAAAAVEESGQRAARALRISRIKEGVDRNLNLLFGRGGGSKEEEEKESSNLGGIGLDFDFLDIGTGNHSSASTSAVRQPRTPAQRQPRTPAPRPSVTMLTEYERTMARISEIEAEANVEGSRVEIPSSFLETEKGVQGEREPPHHQEHASTTTSSISWIGSVWQWLNAFLPRRADRRESALAYTLFVFAYLSDLSLLTMALPLSAFAYALVATRPARAYWHGVLIYCEVIIVSSYAYQVPSRLDCGFLSPQLQRTAEMLGIHSNAARCIPLFFVYLATLRHTHGLITRHAAGVRAAAAAEEPPPGTTARQELTHGSHVDLEGGNGGADTGEVVEIVEDFYEQEDANGDRGAAATTLTNSNSEVNPSSPSAEDVSWMFNIIEVMSKAAAAVCEFILTACAAQCERSPSFLLVELEKSSEDCVRSTGNDIENSLQRVLDTQRAQELAAERFKQTESSTNLSSDSWEGVVSPMGGTHPAAVETRPFACSLASMGPIKLRFHSFLDESVLPPKVPQQPEKESVDDADAAPKKEKVKENKAQTTSTTMNALLEVIPLQCTPQNTPEVCTLSGWPLRALRPAATAATVLVASTDAGSRLQEENTLKVVSAEPHGRQARDFYALTSIFDILAFIFVAVYYNKVVQAAGSLSEITSQHVVPLGYLLTLMTLFMFIVMDRVVYTLGNAAGKAALHVAEMALFFWYCSSLVWDSPDYYSADSGSSLAPSDSLGVPRDHLRILLALKSASFALSALQLRTGYPPPASYANGMGRHTFVFMRSVSWPASLAFHAFTAVPFLYEMRQLLDWACTATTLTLYDWLKLEDINMSLYFAAVMRAARAQKPHGMRQPRYLKFFQGTLLFSLLLVLLWVPLLVFSTGNPTYQVPSLAAFSVNITLQASSPQLGVKLSSPLFRGGDRGTWLQWIEPSTSSGGDEDLLPPALAADYTPEQLQLLCTPPDADSLWTASPPARHALTFVLESHDADVAITFGWNVQRDLPPASEHGGPSCDGTAAVALAEESKIALLQVLQGEAPTAPLLRKLSLLSPSSNLVPTEDQNQDNSTFALFPAFWLMRGDACIARPLQEEDIRGAGEALPSRKRRLPTDLEWADRWLACNASLENSSDNAVGAAVPPSREVWWKVVCGIVDSQGSPILEDIKENKANDMPRSGGSASWPITCPSSSQSSQSPLFTGPRIVVLLDRVQGGIIGATINKFGVVGLYSVFVYGIGRFLRLSVTNLRMRIPFEDLPTTRRLVALCQDIYIARAEGLLGLEEELYGALITVYRLPNLLFALTKKNN